ncbi:MAG: DUF6364 family protein [Mucilaginibacter sp.]
MAKLTLSIEPDKIAKAKSYATKHRTSISKMVSDFLTNEIAKDEVKEDPFLEKLKQMEVPADILALTGVLKGKVPDDVNLWDAKYAYLKQKYDL